MQAKIIRAQLRELIGVKPDIQQKMLIRSLPPLIIQLETWRKDFEEGEDLHPDFSKTQGQIKATFSQLMGTVPANKKKVTQAKADDLNLGGFLG